MATVCGAWLAIRLSGEASDRRSGYVHGILVWSIGLIAGALFLTATRGQAGQAGKVGAAASAGAALGAIAGLLGAVVATGLAGRRGIGRGRGLGWRIAIQRRDDREAYAGDGGRYGEPGHRPTAPGTYGGTGTRPGGLGREEGTTDPYHH